MRKIRQFFWRDIPAVFLLLCIIVAAVIRGATGRTDGGDDPLTDALKQNPGLDGGAIGSSTKSRLNDIYLEEKETKTILEQRAGIKKLDIDVLDNWEDELIFNITIDDYIESYNGYYWKDNSRRYLTPSEDWRSWTEGASVHSEHETQFYYFKEDKNVWTLPTITIYVPTNAGYIQEININFDWHGYTEPMYSLYNEMCFYALKVFFSDSSDEQLINLISEVNSLGYRHVFSSDQRYGSDSVPYAVFYQGNISIYSYFAIGSCQSLCIVPATQETIKTLKEKGAEIYEIS